ncbi:MAG: SHOCT domain-containing protein [Planctomycetes bacterium]|nr:SHOCT domain-containing protein [Planctomycetota bacterium]
MCGSHGTHPKEDSAREILDRRYSRGEINQEEYQRMRKEIQ